MSSTRVEAFSDGVLAIAITLLVLNLQPPSHQPGHLWSRLLDQWPNYAGYVVSFFVIGIIWVNHHAIFRLIARVDRILLFLNLLLLLVVAVIPFPTALLAENIRQGGADSHVAAAIYSATMLAMSAAYTGLWYWATRDDRLLHERVDPAAARATRLRFGLGLGVYLATVGLSFISAPVTLLVHFLVGVYYVFDQLSVDASAKPEPEASS